MFKTNLTRKEQIVMAVAALPLWIASYFIGKIIGYLLADVYFKFLGKK